MPTLTELDQVGQAQQLGKKITSTNISQTPFTSRVKKGVKPMSVTFQEQITSYGTVDHKGVPEGQDAIGFESQARRVLTHVRQKFSYNVSVTEEARDTSVVGVQDEYAWQILQGFTLLGQSVEQRCLSNIDCSLNDNAVNASECRGIFQWLSPTAQTTFPVDAVDRPASATRYTGTVADFDEDAMGDLLEASYTQRAGDVTLEGFVGIKLKRAISLFSSYQSAIAGTAEVRRYQAQNNREVEILVDRFRGDAGVVDLSLSNYLVYDRDGNSTANSTRSGVFLDMGMFELRMLRPPTRVDLPFMGGDYKSHLNCKGALVCCNPVGHASALIAS